MNKQHKLNGSELMRISKLSWILVLVTLLLAASGASAQVPVQSPAAIQTSTGGFELRDGVVVDPASARIYAMSRDGGVEALTVQGEVAWRTDAAARPLGLYGDLVIAQPSESPQGRMELVFLDGTGAGVGSAEVALTPGVVATVAEGPFARFEARARIEDGVPVFDWQHTTFKRGAVMAPDPGRPGAPGAPVAVAARAAGQAALANMNPQTVGGAIAYDPANGVESSVSAVPRNVRPLAGVADLVATEFIPSALQGMRSKDGRHVLIVERAAPGELEEYRWTVFDAQNRARVGSTMSRLGGANFFVSGTTLVHEASPFTANGRQNGLRLVAKSLVDGSPLWDREIFDTAYRGPMPP